MEPQSALVSTLGAAVYMGRQDIANFLLEDGAYLDILAAAMFGKLDIVKAALKVYPATLKTPGLHGLPLIVNAQAGREDAPAVLEYLQSHKGKNYV